MPLIESSPHPLILKKDNHETLLCPHNAEEHRIAIRTMTRALEGLAVKRTMTGYALPIETELEINSNSTKSKIEALVSDALFM